MRSRKDNETQADTTQADTAGVPSICLPTCNSSTFFFCAAKGILSEAKRKEKEGTANQSRLKLIKQNG